MLWKIKENDTLKEILVGILISALIGMIIILLATKEKAYNAAGLLTGMAGAIFMAIHMALTIEDAVLFNENDAISYIRKQTYIRYTIACILVVLVGVIDYGSPVAAVFGLLLLKPGAYLQPLVHKLIGGKADKNFTDSENQVIIDEIQFNSTSLSEDELTNK